MAITKPDVTDVRAIIATDYDDATITALIDDAALIGESCLSSLSSDRQKSAIKWLTAHMLASTNDTSGKQLESESLGDASKSFQKSTMGEGLKGTAYGQQAIAIAPCLLRASQNTASIQVV